MAQNTAYRYTTEAGEKEKAAPSEEQIQELRNDLYQINSDRNGADKGIR